MDFQNKPRFEETALRERCSADCSSCPSFPTPFRRIGDSSYCHFTRLSFAAHEGVTFPGDDMTRLLFVICGTLELDHQSDPVRLVTSNQCVCLTRGESYVATAQDPTTDIVVLSMIHRIEFCERDIFDEIPPPLHSDQCPARVGARIGYASGNRTADRRSFRDTPPLRVRTVS